MPIENGGSGRMPIVSPVIRQGGEKCFLDGERNAFCCAGPSMRNAFLIPTAGLLDLIKQF